MSARTLLGFLCLPLFALALVAPGISAPALAQAPAEEPELAATPDRTESGPVDRTAIDGVLPSRQILMVEIRGLLDQQATSLEKLRAAFAKAQTAEEALAIQRSIEKTKLDTEVAILRAQIPYVKAMGNHEGARQLEEAIAALLDPTLAERHEPGVDE